MKDESYKEVLSLMKRFISNKVAAADFANEYISLWAKKIRDSQGNFSGEEKDILNELHSDCDCLHHPAKDISITNKKLLKIVKEKYEILEKLKENNEKNISKERFLK